jgi:flagellar biosynthesis chaperone FliJ
MPFITIFSLLFSFISSYSPSILLANKASEASEEEVSEKRAELEKAFQDLKDLREERKAVNNQHSMQGDMNHPNEVDLGEYLEALDNSIQELLSLIAELINYLNS